MNEKELLIADNYERICKKLGTCLDGEDARNTFVPLCSTLAYLFHKAPQEVKDRGIEEWARRVGIVIVDLYNTEKKGL